MEEIINDILTETLQLSPTTAKIIEYLGGAIGIGGVYKGSKWLWKSGKTNKPAKTYTLFTPEKKYKKQPATM